MSMLKPMFGTAPAAFALNCVFTVLASTLALRRPEAVFLSQFASSPPSSTSFMLFCGMLEPEAFSSPVRRLSCTVLASALALTGEASFPCRVRSGRSSLKVTVAAPSALRWGDDSRDGTDSVTSRPWPVLALTCSPSTLSVRWVESDSTSPLMLTSAPAAPGRLPVRRSTMSSSTKAPRCKANL